MELKRNVYKKPVEWKEKNTGRVLELKGARQTGEMPVPFLSKGSIDLDIGWKFE